VSYGQRWMAETVFSSIKRTFGEYVTAKVSEYGHFTSLFQPEYFMCRSWKADDRPSIYTYII